MRQFTVIFLQILIYLCWEANACIKTLYAFDSQQVGITFAAGEDSVKYDNFWAVNAGVDIAWGEFLEGQFTIAPEGSVSLIQMYPDLVNFHRKCGRCSRRCWYPGGSE